MTFEIGQTCMLVNIGLTRSECASWVQAWGSIGAIAMTAWAVHWAHMKQVRQKQREQRVEYTSFLETLFQLIGSARQIARKIADLEYSPGSSLDDRHTMLAELAALADAMRRMDLNRLDRYEYVEAWLVADALVRKLIDAISIYDLPGSNRDLVRGNLEFLAGRVVETLDVRGARMHAAIQERGGPPSAEPMPRDWSKRPVATS